MQGFCTVKSVWTHIHISQHFLPKQAHFYFIALESDQNLLFTSLIHLQYIHSTGLLRCTRKHGVRSSTYTPVYKQNSSSPCQKQSYAGKVTEAAAASESSQAAFQRVLNCSVLPRLSNPEFHQA